MEPARTPRSTQPESSPARPSSRPLTQEQTLQVRRTFANALNQGVLPERIAQRNEALQGTFECSLTQIVAIQSQMKIQAERQLKAHGLDALVNREHLIAASEDWFVGAAFTPDEQLSAAHQTLERLSGRTLCRDAVRTIMERYAAYIEGTPPKAHEESAPAVEAEPERPTPHLSMASLPPMVEPDAAVGAEYTNYDFPAKVAWRREIVESLDRALAGVSPATRGTMRVLFLPSVNKATMKTQVRLLQGIGFQPHNMYGVEGTKDDDLQRQFCRHATELGIIPVCGRLETLLPKDPNKYGCVWLDFPGPISQTYRTIVRNLLLADTAAVSMNLMEGRESGSVQHSLDFTRLMNNRDGLQYVLGHQDEFCEHDFSYALLREKLERGADVPDAADLRQEMAEGSLLNILGDTRAENLVNIKPHSAQMPGANLGANAIRFHAQFVMRHVADYFKKVFQTVGGNYVDQLRDAAAARRPITNTTDVERFASKVGKATLWPTYPELVRIITAYCTFSPMIGHIERCTYQSAAESRRYFYSVTARINTPRGTYNELRRTGEALRNYMLRYLQKNDDPVLNALPTSIELCDEHGRPPKIQRATPQNTDRIEIRFRQPNGTDETVLRLQYSHLRADLGRLHELHMRIGDFPLAEIPTLPQKRIEG